MKKNRKVNAKNLPGDLPELTPIEETLMIPLCYRAVEARQPNPLIQDPRAAEIIDCLKIDPAHIKWREEQHVFAMLRARQVDRWAQAYLAAHPQSVVVEVGCGLDARFERVDNGQVTWFDMDLPEVISLRQRFFNDTPRRQMLAHSVFQLDWMDNIPVRGSHLFLIEGVFPYFEEDEVRRVIIALSERFPGSELVLDALSPFMVRSSSVVPWFRGYQTRPRWGLSDPHKIESWGGGIRLLECYGYFDQPEPRLKHIRWMARASVLHDIARVLRLGLGTSQ